MTVFPTVVVKSMNPLTVLVTKPRLLLLSSMALSEMGSEAEAVSKMGWTGNQMGGYGIRHLNRTRVQGGTKTFELVHVQGGTKGNLHWNQKVAGIRCTVRKELCYTSLFYASLRREYYPGFYSGLFSGLYSE